MNRTACSALLAALVGLASWALPAPPVAAGDASPKTFASEPNPTWGTGPAEDPKTAGSDRAGKVLAIAEVGDRVFLAGEFTGVMPPGASTNKAGQDPTPIVPRRASPTSSTPPKAPRWRSSAPATSPWAATSPR